MRTQFEIRSLLHEIERGGESGLKNCVIALILIRWWGWDSWNCDEEGSVGLCIISYQLLFIIIIRDGSCVACVCEGKMQTGPAHGTHKFVPLFFSHIMWMLRSHEDVTSKTAMKRHSDVTDLGDNLCAHFSHRMACLAGRFSFPWAIPCMGFSCWCVNTSTHTTTRSKEHVSQPKYLQLKWLAKSLTVVQ